VVTLQLVDALAALLPARQRGPVVVATSASLRFGEVSALHRMDVDRTVANPGQGVPMRR